MGPFIKSDDIKAVDDLSSIIIGDEENELADELGIGHKAWEFISAEDYMHSNVTQMLFSGVESFYRAVSSIILKKFSSSDNLVAFLLPQNQDKVVTALILLASIFSAATPDCLDALEEETLDHILLPSSSLTFSSRQ